MQITTGTTKGLNSEELKILASAIGVEEKLLEKIKTVLEEELLEEIKTELAKKTKTKLEEELLKKIKTKLEEDPKVKAELEEIKKNTLGTLAEARLKIIIKTNLLLLVKKILTVKIPVKKRILILRRLFWKKVFPKILTEHEAQITLKQYLFENEEHYFLTAYLFVAPPSIEQKKDKQLIKKLEASYQEAKETTQNDEKLRLSRRKNFFLYIGFSMSFCLAATVAVANNFEMPYLLQIIAGSTLLLIAFAVYAVFALLPQDQISNILSNITPTDLLKKQNLYENDYFDMLLKNIQHHTILSLAIQDSTIVDVIIFKRYAYFSLVLMLANIIAIIVLYVKYCI